MPKTSSPTTAIMITAGTAIGAGMFSIPIVASGMWFSWTVVAMAGIWFVNYLCALYLLEVNVTFERGANFETISKTLFGPVWSKMIAIGFAFLLYLLMYAYFSAFGSTASTSFGLGELEGGRWLSSGASLLFGMFLAFMIWMGAKVVGRISGILVAGIIITFILSMSGFSFQVEAAKLFDFGDENGYVQYIWIALPYLITSFGFLNVVPSLYKFYGDQPKLIKSGLLVGSILAFLISLIFVVIAFGSISREAYIPINQAGGNVGTLMAAMQAGETSDIVNWSLSIFTNFAIISSFLGVGLGLFDFVADTFKIDDSSKGRFYTACISFLPSGIASFFFPNGFILAIGYAGLIFVVTGLIAVYFMVRLKRSSGRKGSYQVAGGNVLLVSYLLANVLVGVCQVLAMFDLLPQW
jgi:tryptophan-specific transport protein